MLFLVLLVYSVWRGFVIFIIIVNFIIFIVFVNFYVEGFLSFLFVFLEDKF